MLDGREDMVGGEAVTGLAHMLGRANRRITDRLAEVVVEHGHTLEEWRVLVVLVDGLRRPMREVAEAAAMPGPTLTKIVDRMVATGLVDRHSDAGDRRRVLLSLTLRGRALHVRLGRLMEAEGASIEEQVGPGEMVELARLLERLLARITLDGSTPSQ